MKLIAAVTHDFGIGYQNNLLFKFKTDLKWFKEKTIGQTCIMGYNTFMSLPVTKTGERLPGREIIVLCNPKHFSDCLERGAKNVVSEVTEGFIERYQDAFVIGGAKCWKSLAYYIDTMYLTHIASLAPQTDAFFPVAELCPGSPRWKQEVIKCEVEDNTNLTFVKYVLIKNNADGATK